MTCGTLRSVHMWGISDEANAQWLAGRLRHWGWASSRKRPVSSLYGRSCGGAWWATLPRPTLGQGGGPLPVGEQARCFGVLDSVAVALLSEEELAIGREILVAGVASND